MTFCDVFHTGRKDRRGRHNLLTEFHSYKLVFYKSHKENDLFWAPAVEICKLALCATGSHDTY